MLDIIFSDDGSRWDDRLADFRNTGVYYLREYCNAFRLHGDGSSALLYYEDDSGLKGVCVIMIRDVADIPFFNSRIDNGTIFDAVSPYGYGGFVFNRPVDLAKQSSIGEELIACLSERNIISFFVRFSPVINNVGDSRNIIDTTDLGHTIAMELDSPETIWTNLTSKHRNMIRKAEKSGVEIKHGRGEELMNEFVPIYEATMEKDNAQDYYYFKKPFYDSIVNDLKDNYEIFYAVYEERIISAAIILFRNSQMEYHLSGSLSEFRNLAAGNLLLYKAALWGCEQGFKTFHLGGGVGSGEDSLYKFKAGFNRNSDYRFSIGKLIVDQERYDFLVKLRENNDPNFNPSSNFFPLYRS